MTHKLIGYARVSTRGQDTDRQVQDLLAAGVRRDDLYQDNASGARLDRVGYQAALDALEPGDTLVVTTLDRLGRTTATMLELAQSLNDRGVHLRVLNLGGGVMDTSTPMGEMLFTVMAALAQMEREVRLERSRDSLAKRREKGLSLGGRPERFTRAQKDDAVRAVRRGESPAQVARERGMSRASLYRWLAEAGQPQQLNLFTAAPRGGTHG